MSVEDALGQGAGLEQAEAQQRGVTYTGPDRRADVFRRGDVMHKHHVDRHTDDDEKCLETSARCW